MILTPYGQNPWRRWRVHADGWYPTILERVRWAGDNFECEVDLRGIAALNADGAFEWAFISAVVGSAWDTAVRPALCYPEMRFEHERVPLAKFLVRLDESGVGVNPACCEFPINELRAGAKLARNWSGLSPSSGSDRMCLAPSWQAYCELSNRIKPPFVSPAPNHHFYANSEDVWADLSGMNCIDLRDCRLNSFNIVVVDQRGRIDKLDSPEDRLTVMLAGQRLDGMTLQLRHSRGAWTGAASPMVRLPDIELPSRVDLALVSCEGELVDQRSWDASPSPQKADRRPLIREGEEAQQDGRACTVAPVSGSVDVLIVTALKLELDALKAVESGLEGNWEEVASDPPYWVATFTGAAGRVQVVAVRLTEMGGVATALGVGALISRLAPRCIAMCGVCAGHPEQTDLGDVILADRVYQHDFGKQKADSFQGDLWVHATTKPWRYVAQELEGPAKGLHGYIEPDEQAAQWWFLDKLLPDQWGVPHNPLLSAAMQRYFPATRRAALLEELEQERGYVTLAGETFKLTEAGATVVRRHNIHHGYNVEACPYHVHVGPIASGNKVEADGSIWKRLAEGGMRKVLGVEMEAATIGALAETHGCPFVVAKSVMDHADPKKSERYKHFAARVAAEVLLHFLRRVIRPAQAREAENHDAQPQTPPVAVREDPSRRTPTRIYVDVSGSTHQQSQDSEGFKYTIRNLSKNPIRIECVTYVWSVAEGHAADSERLRVQPDVLASGETAAGSFAIPYEAVKPAGERHGIGMPKAMTFSKYRIWIRVEVRLLEDDTVEVVSRRLHRIDDPPFASSDHQIPEWYVAPRTP